MHHKSVIPAFAGMTEKSSAACDSTLEYLPFLARVLAGTSLSQPGDIALEGRMRFYVQRILLQ